MLSLARLKRRLKYSGLGLALAASSACHGSEALAAPGAQGAGRQRSEASRAKTWRYAWTSVNAGLMAGDFAAVALVSRENRPDWIISGIGCGVTVLTTWFWPLRVESAADELDELPPPERDHELARLRRESAEDEHQRIRWPWHLVNIGLASAGGAIVAFGYGHYASGAINAVVGGAIGEVQIFTQPTALYREGPTIAALLPRFGFTPRLGALGPTWTMSVGGSF